jgi:hypothetical protein
MSYVRVWFDCTTGRVWQHLSEQTQQAMSTEGASYGAGRSMGTPSMTPETRNMLQEAYYPGYTGEPEASGAMTLDSLADPPPGAKPRYPYSTLIR